jgi:hypothetical protein
VTNILAKVYLYYMLKVVNSINILCKCLFIYSLLLLFGTLVLALASYYTGNNHTFITMKGILVADAISQLMFPWRVFRNIGFFLSLLLMVLAFLRVILFKEGNRIKTLFFTLGKVLLIMLILFFSYPFAAAVASTWLYYARNF